MKKLIDNYFKRNNMLSKEKYEGFKEVLDLIKEEANELPETQTILKEKVFEEPNSDIKNYKNFGRVLKKYMHFKIFENVYKDFIREKEIEEQHKVLRDWYPHVKDKTIITYTSFYRRYQRENNGKKLVRIDLGRKKGKAVETMALATRC